MGGIFISYRREDTGPYAGRLRDALKHHFGDSQVFRDIDRINPGERFPHVIEQAVGSCDALLAVIGPQWQTPRLDDPDDYLRREIAAALERPDVLVVPVLIGAARVPSADDLPPPLAGLADCQAVHLNDEGWDDQVARLIRALEAVVEPATLERPVAPPPPPAQPPRSWKPAPPRPVPPSIPPRSRSRFPVGILVAVLVVIGLLTALGIVAVKVISGVDFGPGNPAVTISPDSGPPGTQVTVTGTGFGANETVDVRFHASEVGTTQADAAGAFSLVVTVPNTPFRNQQFDIGASGKRTVRHDSAPFMVT
ncbi:MAG: TIR domain-containing protein [Acidimicrobiales bacterium]